jgi:hypothetical protein
MPATNPFIYNRPVQPEDLIDREREVEQLLSLAAGGHSTRLSAPRRYGKTSLLRRVLSQAPKMSMTPVYVDFYGVLAIDEIAMRIEEAYSRDLQGPLKRTIINLMRMLRPTAYAGSRNIGIQLAPAPEMESIKILTQFLDLPLRIYEKTGKRVLVVFDEFQSLLGASNTVDALMRSRIQHHGQAASYIFAGSHPGLMSELFNRRERPFYGQSRPIVLRALSDPDLAQYIDARFAQTDRDPGPGLDALLKLVRGHPQRAMLTAHHLWENTPQGQIATSDTWSKTLTSVFTEIEEAMQSLWDRLEPKQRTVMTAVATSQAPLYSKQTLSRFKISKSAAQSARKQLLATGDLQSMNSSLELTDPLFEQWIRRGHLGNLAS